jgi:cellulose synthase/poly-beta-1,6-N-acetylglucosamine synthase-like glycosyltransferase
MSGLLALLAVTCPLAVVYSYVVYPLMLLGVAVLYQAVRDTRFVLAKLDRRYGSAAATDATLPAVAVIISAYNEEQHIVERARNVLAQDYPADRLTLYIGSDGSVDGTVERLRGITDPRLHVVAYPRNRGKASVLNDLVALGSQPVLIFSDANTEFAPGALRHLVSRFADDRVGCVTGELRLRSVSSHNKDGLYWRIEQVLKFFESRIGGSLGANGAIYGVRREFWRALAPDTICDDFCVAMNVVAQGRWNVYEPSAWAIEDTPAHIGDEYARRVRIGVGNFQALIRHPEYILRTNWATRFAYVSHKILRWLGPHLVLLGLLLSALSWSAATGPASRWWAAFIGVQVAILLASGLLYATGDRRAKAGKPLPGILAVPAFLFALNYAFLIASYRAFGGQATGAWVRTGR